jgi:hypothetical protein
MKTSIIVAGLVVSCLTTGCMTGYYARHERRQMVERDTLAPPPMTVDDVIALAQDSVADEIILEQIKATHSWFQLTNNDIRDLKKNGVGAKVISAMIKSADEPKTRTTRSGYYSPYYAYPDYYWYPYSSYYSGWYSPAYMGFSIGGGHYGGYHFGGGRMRFHR